MLIFFEMTQKYNPLFRNSLWHIYMKIYFCSGVVYVYEAQAQVMKGWILPQIRKIQPLNPI